MTCLRHQALPAGFADDDFGFHYVEPEAADAPLAQRRETTEAMTLQRKISSARSVGVVLDLVTVSDLDALHVATALHRLARLGGRGLAASTAVEALLKRLEDGTVEKLGAQAQVSLLWAAAKLSLGGPWLSRLGKALEVSDLSGHQLATAFYAVARLESGGFPAQEFQDLVEQLHRELQRRQKALGPGGTSALDSILLADALAKLQIRDEPLFSSLATALLKHLEAKQLGVRELRHAASAFGQMGFVDKQLMAKMMGWLQTRLDDCSSSDLSALAFSFSRCVPAVPSAGRAFFGALPQHLAPRVELGEVSPQEAAVFLVSFSQAHLLDDHAESLMRLAPLIEKSPNALNGHWMALLVPGISHLAKASLMEVLANRSSQLSATLSPRQLARLAIGFGQGQLQSPKLWQSLTKEAMSKSGSFSAPDTLRLLAGLDAAKVNDRKLLKIFWARVAEKQAKYLAEELLALLQLWPRLPPELRSDELPRDLMKHLRTRLEKGTKGLGWVCPGELAVELLEWLPSSRHLTGRPLDLRLLRAMLLQLPRQLRSGPETRQRLLSALTTDPELWSKARSELLPDEKFHRALGKICQDHQSDDGWRDSAVELVFSCAQLGVDSRELQKLLQQLLQEPLQLAQSAKVCWACAELGVLSKEAEKLLQVADGDTQDALSWLRLSWASLVLQRPLPLRVTDLPGEVLMQQMSPSDLRPLQQLAWHSQQHLGLSSAWSDAMLGAGPLVPRTAKTNAGSAGGSMPSQTDAEKLLSSLLQNLRVPHVVASSKAVPGNIYRVPLWFPAANAVLDLSTSSDRLISGKYSGTARMRRRQL
ncbi:unnamed protein product, partial [Cladocopium goreaui]